MSARARRNAKVGRPVASSGDRGCRERILSAARELLREKGLSQPTLRAIAERAGVDPALINYYFGSKRELYEELAVGVYEGVYNRVTEAAAGAYASPAERARAVVRASVLALARDPYAPSLVAMLDAEYGEVPQRVNAFAWKLYRLSDEVFAAPATAHGPATSNSTFIATSIAGVTAYFFLAITYCAGLDSRADLAPEVLDAWADFVADLHIRGLGIPEAAAAATDHRKT